MEQKKVLVYVNPIFYFDTDCTVLCHLTKEYHVIWYAIAHTSYPMKKYTMDDLKQYAIKNGIEYKPYYMNCRMRSLKSFVYYYQLVKDVKRQNSDVIFTSIPNLHWHLWTSILLCKNNIIQGVHDVEMHSSTPMKKLFTLVNSFRLRIYKYYVTYSKSQQQLLKQKYGKESVCVGMSLKNFGLSSMGQPNSMSPIKLLFFGTISRYKGLDLLIDAIEQCYLSGINNLQLSVCGDGPYRNECLKHIKTSKLYNLQIRFIENNEIADIMSTHHFLVLPYRDVTNSGPMMIAVNYKLPLIAPNIGCFKDVYSDKTGFLYAPGNLFEALKNVAYMKEDVYQSMKMACGDLFKQYTEEAIAVRYISFFNNISLSNADPVFRDNK